MTRSGTEATGFPLPLDLPPMEARLVDKLPEGPGWQFEPKWDGFRCLAFRAGDEVELRAKKQAIGTIKVGEIFGEIAVIAHAPRSAGAVAKTECRVIALDPEEFETALAHKPAFALMLMSMLIRRLRETIAQLSVSGALSHDEDFEEAIVFDKKQLQELVAGLADDSAVERFAQRFVAALTAGDRSRVAAAIHLPIIVRVAGWPIKIRHKEVLVRGNQQRLAIVIQKSISCCPGTRDAVDIVRDAEWQPVCEIGRLFQFSDVGGCQDLALLEDL